jgi:cell division protease FtsH
MQVPTEDRFLMKKTELLSKIASLLGGRAAEDLVFGDISTGAHNDLARATDIAKSMIKEYGMSDTLGQVYFAREKRNLFLEAGLGEAGDYSEATAQEIDKEIRNIIRTEYAKALDILKNKQDVLHRGARLLLEKEKVDGAELRALLDNPQKTDNEA